VSRLDEVPMPWIGRTRSTGARSPRDGERLFAAWIALAIVMVAARFQILTDLPEWLPYLPLMAFQDIAVAGAGSLLFAVLLTTFRRPMARRAICLAGWGICLLLALDSVLSAMVFHLVRAPVSYRLIQLSDHLRGISVPLQEQVTVFRIIKLALAPIAVIAIAEALCRYFANPLERGARAFQSPLGAIGLAVYCIVAQLWIGVTNPYAPAITNAQVAMARSLFETPALPHGGKVLNSYFEDFRPAGALAPRPIAETAPGRRPLSVLMVVMESVGTRYLEVYGAQYRDTPNMVRLAQRGVRFDRFYAARPATSSAMAALFCSIFPNMGWESISHETRDTAIPGIAQALAARGYRTAFIHEGSLSYDGEAEFLAHHGFAEIYDKRVDVDVPCDVSLLNAAANWLRKDTSRPFFLVLWTKDTHYPYFAAQNNDYGVKDVMLNRYLNAIHSSDHLIGSLAENLKAMGISDDTLLVVTGDHGEAFGEHSQRIHDFTVYEEEVHVPLLMVSPRLFQTPREIEAPGEEVDLPVTLLKLIGYPVPAQWQGRDLFEKPRDGRVYLSANAGNFAWGLIDGEKKYVFDENRNLQIYDLASDPLEKRNLAKDSRFTAWSREAGARLEAWSEFQDRFLESLKPSKKSATGVRKTLMYVVPQLAEGSTSGGM